MGQTDLDQRAESLLDRGLPGRWYVVAKSGDLPSGAVRAIKALDRELVVWRGADGQVRCLEDRCPHRGARLSLGESQRFGPGLSLPRRHARRARPDRACAGDWKLRTRGPQDQRVLCGHGSGRRRLRLVPGTWPGRARAARAAARTHEPGMGALSHDLAVELQLSLRARQPRRPDARHLSAQRHVHVVARHARGQGPDPSRRLRDSSSSASRSRASTSTGPRLRSRRRSRGRAC